MDTLALVLVAARHRRSLISVPLGILAARVDTVASAIIRPVLDFMQTMPAFVYLIPALILFRVGVVPGIVATIIFAMAPGVRLTELGIRGVDKRDRRGRPRVRRLAAAHPAPDPAAARAADRSWPASTRSSCCRSRWSSSPAWSAPAASAATSSRALQPHRRRRSASRPASSVVILAIFLDRVTAALGAAKHAARQTAAASCPSGDAGTGPLERHRRTRRPLTDQTRDRTSVRDPTRHACAIRQPRSSQHASRKETP